MKMKTKKLLSPFLVLVTVFGMFAGIHITAGAAEPGLSMSDPIVLQDGVPYAKYWTIQNKELNCYNQITVPSDGIIVLTLEKSFDSSKSYGGYELVLYSQDGENLWMGSTRGMKYSDFDEYVLKIGVKAGTYYLDIIPLFYTGNDGLWTEYQYTFTASDCWETEPNGNAEEATMVDTGKTYYGEYCEETYRAAHEDWYGVNMKKGNTYRISIGNFDELCAGTTLMTLVNPTGGESELMITMKSDGKRDGNVCYISYTAAVSGVHYIRLYNHASGVPVEYFLTVTGEHTHLFKSKVTKAATCVKAGTKTFTCSCGDKYTQRIPATGKHTYQTTVTKKATTSKDGKAVLVCSVCKASKNTVIPKVTTFKLSAKLFVYNGKTKTPVVSVYDSKGNKLKKNTDYTVSCPSNRKKIGNYTVKITLKGKYSGSGTQVFSIVPGTPTLKATAGSRKATLSWNKQAGATGYIVYMATSKTGTYNKIATLSGNTKVSYTKTGLTKGKTYYFSVIAYTTVNGKTIYGSLSSIKSVKVK